MGHAEHFLSRLKRLDAQQEELALALYRDPELVRAVVEAARVPEGAGRVALALNGEPSPPHILVERDGAFVTCLGPGMRTHDAHVVPHSEFRALREQQISLRQVWDRAYAAADDRASRSAISMLIGAGGTATREQMRSTLAIAPLLRTEHIRGFTGLVEDFLRMRDQIARRPPAWVRKASSAEPLRAAWQVSWAMSHMSLIMTAVDPEQRACGLLAQLMVPVFYEAMSTSFLPFALRLAWVMGQIGAPAADLIEGYRDTSEGTFSEIFEAVAMATIGAANPALRDRALRFFEERKRGRCPPEIGDFRDSIGEALLEPEAFDAELVARGREEIWEPLRAQKRLRWSSPEHIPAQLARAKVANLELDLLGATGSALSVLARATPWLGRAKAEELYLAAEDTCYAEPFSVERGARLVAGFRRFDRRPQQPIRVERGPGRNDPCPCNSGKKFKKCCAA